MPKHIELKQIVSRAINYTTWHIPRIRDGDVWRNINNAHLVENPRCINGYDRFGNGIFRVKQIMEDLGWHTEITDTREACHEHLYYQHYRLTAWK